MSNARAAFGGRWSSFTVICGQHSVAFLLRLRKGWKIVDLTRLGLAKQIQEKERVIRVLAYRNLAVLGLEWRREAGDREPHEVVGS